ncbi:DUF2442 domain-containing protein [Persicitalea sp.]|uniref:DUF2442 domain-containing protein n=1 Tax=Persicitalea sp. TaxID=3100273 RepID=UPI003592F63E
MNPRVKKVTPLNGQYLQLEFTNNECRKFDVGPYFEMGVFSELKEKKVFNTVRVFNGTVVWDNELDFCPDTLYLESERQRFPKNQ